MKKYSFSYLEFKKIKIGIVKLDSIDPKDEYFEIRKTINHETTKTIPK